MKSICRSISLLMCALCWAVALMAQSDSLYNWKSVQIHGGGFVTGLIYNTTEKGLLYARTDVGGAFRWDTTTKAWIPLQDFDTNTLNWGVSAIATDPVEPNRVYMACGQEYPFSTMGVIYASEDKGKTWKKSNLTFRQGGNENGRSAGERLQVDPNSNNILFLGSNNDGLWKSVDYGATWNFVPSFPVAQASGVQVSFIVFDKSSGTKGNRTPAIYVGLMRRDSALINGRANLYKSIDGGDTWTPITAMSSVTRTLMPQRAVLDKLGNLSITYTNQSGPNGVTAGDVLKYNTITNKYTKITPVIAGTTPEGGFAGISIDPNNPNFMIVSSSCRWLQKDEIFVTNDGGATWKISLNNGTIDRWKAPYAASKTPHWIGCAELDPFNPNNAWFVTGFGVFATTNLTDVITDKKVTWRFWNEGLEETVIMDLSPNPLGFMVSGVGDIDGFRHDTFDIPPVRGAFRPNRFTYTASIDYAQDFPNTIVRSYAAGSLNYGSISYDGAVTWTMFATYPVNTTNGGRIAISSDAKTLVWSPTSDSVYVSSDSGKTWIRSKGISIINVFPIADKTAPSRFYIHDAPTGTLYVSNDGGFNFSPINTSLPKGTSRNIVRTFATKPNYVWVSTSSGIFFSTNGGLNFTRVANVVAPSQFSLGKAAPNKSFPAMYVIATIRGVLGFYRSDDSARTWVSITDSLNNQFRGARVIAADLNVYSRVFLGTGGRGIFYGELQGTIPPITNPGDSIELVGLYKRTGGINWNNNTNWLSYEPLSSWQGIAVDNGRVTAVELPNNNLNGVLPNTLFLTLTKMATCNLSNNMLSGTVASMINNTNLQVLNLSKNLLSGSIPVLPRPNAKIINLSGNRFTGTASNLNVGANNYTFYYGKIEEYDLSNNLLTGNLPTAGLAYLYDTTTKTYPGIQCNTFLRKVDMSNNLFTGGLRNTMAPSVQYYDVSYNQISAALAAPTANVTYYNVSHNKLTGNIGYWAVTKLQTLNVSNNLLAGNLPFFNGRTQFLSLKYLNLDSNKYLFGNIEPIVATLPGQSGAFFNAANGGVTINNAQDTLLRINYSLNGRLSTTATGTLNSHTYNWYKADNTLVFSKNADSTFTPTEPGSFAYYATITNTRVPGLVLRTALSPIILPVSFLQFTASLVSPSLVNLLWSTTAEINNKMYLVQRSADGITYYNVQQVLPTLATNGEYRYSVTDVLPHTNAQTWLYRIQQIDYNGQATYSNVVYIQTATNQSLQVAIYPNPVTANAKLQVIAPASAWIRYAIVDASGKTVEQQQVWVQKGATNFSLNHATGLLKGNYWVVVTDLQGHQLQRVSFIKQ